MDSVRIQHKIMAAVGDLLTYWLAVVVSESYITHIRITEDAAHASVPPPPDSPPEGKKPRLIIIAVRSTGRVRMHKARENNNGSFSIGKTWNLEELTAIESFSDPTAPSSNPNSRQQREWAGNVGFTVTITKPYFWQAGTPKEKDFFVASLVKIFRKYTKGQVPELRGFSSQEVAAITGAPQAPPSSHGAPEPPRPPFAAGQERPQSRDESRYRQSPGPPGSIDERRPPSATRRHPSESPGRVPSAQGFRPPQLQQVPRQYPSNEQMRSQSREGPRLAPPGRGGFGPPSSQLQTPTPQSSHSQLRSESPSISSVSSTRDVPPNSMVSGVAPAKAAQAPPQLRPQSPARNRSYQYSIDSVPEERQVASQAQPPPQQNGNVTNGAGLFNATRQRWMAQSQQPPPQIETSQPPPREMDVTTPTKEPMTAESEASSGFDLGDAAAIGAITSYWGPEPTPAAPALQSPSSPPTPERRRPPLEQKPSEASFDLRPAPLNQNRSLRPQSPESSQYNTPTGGHTPMAGSNLPTPKLEEPPQIAPLNVGGKDSALSVPGAFSPAGSLGPSPLSSPAATPGEEKDEEEAHRPGLGPMIRKQKVAERFKKAATAANAFKPRPGGAAAKILAEKARKEAEVEPDGINAVVPRPSTARTESRDDSRVVTPVDLAVKEPQAQEIPPEEPMPRVEVSSPVVSPTQMSHPVVDGAHMEDGVTSGVASPLQSPPEELKEEPVMKAPEPKKMKRRSDQQEKYLRSLGLDSRLLDSRGLEYEAVITDFGWSSGSLQKKHFDELDTELKRELGRVEAGSWLGHLEQKDERVEQVQKMLDRAIAECDELEGLLTLYTVELSSLNDDVAFIEAQGQGLQVQTANQKLLHTELGSLVDTISIQPRQLDPLRHGDLGSTRGLEEVETSLVMLYKAMITIDPALRHSGAAVAERPKSRMGENEVSRMMALQEKKHAYLQESTNFCQRLMQHLDYAFTTSLNGAKNDLARPVSARGSSSFRLNAAAFSAARGSLWQYSPLLLYTKEVNTPAWDTLLRFYWTRAKPLYVDAFRETIAGWKRTVRKPTGDEADLLFTTQEKESSDGLTSTARKLTVKRSQTLAKGLRAARTASGDDRSPGSFMPSEGFARALDELAPLVSQEQNFVVDLFHATTLENQDFVDAVAILPPDSRHGTDLMQRKLMEPDREMAGRVSGVMDEIFSFFAPELTTLVDWSVANDPIQGVGIMTALARHTFFLHESSQEFLLHLIAGLMDRLQKLFTKFVDEQIRAIEDTKVKIHKRKGVIAFMKIFPHFAAAVENVFSSVAANDEGAESVQEVRRLVDDAYARINRAMFDSLKVIAKESPTAGQVQQSKGEDPEDKEMLNYHILLIENFNHYVEEVDDGGKEGVLAEWKGRALLERLEALEDYVKRVVRRPLGKLLVSATVAPHIDGQTKALTDIQDFLESTESALASAPSPTSVASRPSHSRKAARNLLSQYDGKEVRKGIETLRKRIEKHFGDADDLAISRELVAFVCRECERRYEAIIDRTQRVIEEVYPPSEGEKAVELEFSKGDVQTGFRR